MSKEKPLQAQIDWPEWMTPEERVRKCESVIAVLERDIQALQRQKVAPEREELEKANNVISRQKGDINLKDKEIAALRKELASIKEGSRIPALEKACWEWSQRYRVQQHENSLLHDIARGIEHLERSLDQAWRLLEDRREPSEETLQEIVRARDEWLKRCAQVRLRRNCHCDLCKEANAHATDILLMPEHTKEAALPAGTVLSWELMKREVAREFEERSSKRARDE